MIEFGRIVGLIDKLSSDLNTLKAIVVKVAKRVGEETLSKYYVNLIKGSLDLSQEDLGEVKKLLLAWKGRELPEDAVRYEHGQEAKYRDQEQHGLGDVGFGLGAHSPGSGSLG